MQLLRLTPSYVAELQLAIHHSKFLLIHFKLLLRTPGSMLCGDGVTKQSESLEHTLVRRHVAGRKCWVTTSSHYVYDVCVA